MEVRSCEKCNQKFELEVYQMNIPKERESYYCPYCNHEHTERIRGSFGNVQPLPESER